MATRELAERSFLVTGASSGIGRSVLESLVSRGASVVVATRSEEKTRPLLDELRRQHPGADVLWLPLNLSDLRSVAKSADVFLQSGRPLHVLVNNAGVAGAAGMTPDGYEMTAGTNHLGPFLLTERLLPRLREAPAARIVNVASLAMNNAQPPIDWDDFTRPGTGPRDRFRRYGLSKLFNVMHARELSRRLQGTRVTTYSLHPGVIASDVWRELPRLVQAVMKLFMGTNKEGAEQVLHCALAPELEGSSGRFYHRFKEWPPNPMAEDDALCAELYRRSEELIARALKAKDAAPATAAV